MIYDLSKNIDKTKAAERFKQLLEAGKRIELTDKTKRTLSQNNYLHLILAWFGIEHGYKLDFVKVNYFKILCNKNLFIAEKVCKFTGEMMQEIRSSKDLTTAELTEAIQRFRNWSSENGTYLPEPHEREYLDEIEMEIQRNRIYL